LRKQPTVADIVHVMDTFAPPQLAMVGDNVGLQIGRMDKPVYRVLIALDAYPEVISEAVASQTDMLVTHHAMLFRPLTRIDTSSARGRALVQVLASDLAVFNAHTNLDIAQGGVNDVLAKLFGLEDVTILDLLVNDHAGKPQGIGRVGNLAGGAATLQQFAEHVRDALGMRHIRFSGAPKTQIRRVAVLGGSGGKWVNKALQHGADVLVTSDCDHHTVAEAWQDGLAIIDATHAALEVPVLQQIAMRIREAYSESVDVAVRETPEDPFRWI